MDSGNGESSFEFISITHDSLALRDRSNDLTPSGSISSVATGRAAVTGHRDYHSNEPGAQSSGQVEATRVVGVPTFSEPGDDGVFGAGETVEVTFSFSQVLDVDVSGGTPSVEILMSGQASRRAGYLRGSGTAQLVFGYALTASDGEHNSLLLVANSLALNGGAIRDGVGHDADTAHLGAGAFFLPPSPAVARNAAATGAPSDHRHSPGRRDPDGADTSGIADADGIDNATFAYQWIATDGDGDSDISGATSRTYTLAASDQGKTVKVRVSFTDDAGNEESLTSASTAAVGPPPLTAGIHDAPADPHDGSSSFTFELRFSEQFPLSYRTLRDHAFTVTGGEVIKARRLEPGRNVRWEISIRPDSNGTVTIVLPVTTGCGDDGGFCTSDGRMLSGRLEITVPGPGG